MPSSPQSETVHGHRRREDQPAYAKPWLGLVLAALGLAAMVSAQEAGNLLTNGDYELLNAEGGPTNWSVRDWGDHSQAKAKVIGGGVVGPRCLQLVGETHPLFYGVFSQPVTVGPTPPETMLLSLWYRTAGSPQADVSVATFHENFTAAEWRTPVLTSDVLPLDDCAGWKRATWLLRLLPSVQQIIVMVRIHGAGTLLVDGVALQPLPGPVGCEVLQAGTVTSFKGLRVCELKLTNRTAAALPLTITLEASAPQAPRGSAAANLTLPARAEQRLSLPYNYPLNTLHQLQLTVAAPGRGPLYQALPLAVPGLISAYLEAPVFRSTLLASIPTPAIRVRGRLNAAPDLLRQISLEGFLLGVSTAHARVQPEANGEFACQFPAEAMLSGNYGVQLRATVAGAEIARHDVPVSKREAKGVETGYDQRLRLVLQGQPAFPVGVFFALESADLKAAAEAGFNCLVLPSSFAGQTRWQDVAALGMSALVSSASQESGFWKNMVDKHGARGELAGWYVLQKPDTQSPPASPALMADLYSRLRVLDPARPICLALGSLSRLDHYAPFADVIMPWTEPEPPGDLRSVDAMIQRALELAGGQRPVWPVIQMTGAAYSQDSRMDPQTTGRPPTPQEYRCMVFLALARGCQGVFSYALNMPTARNQRPFDVRRDAPPLWEMVKVVGAQVKALIPALLEGTLVPVTSDGLPPSVALRAFRYREYVYVMVVNPTGETVPLRFSVPGLKTHKLNLGFAPGEIQGTEAGVFGDALEPHGVRVYTGKWE